MTAYDFQDAQKFVVEATARTAGAARCEGACKQHNERTAFPMTLRIFVEGSGVSVFGDVDEPEETLAAANSAGTGRWKEELFEMSLFPE